MTKTMQTEAVTAFIGIGGNLGQARATVLAAIEALAQLPQTQLIARSPLYGSAPLGANADGPMYVNAVAQLHTCLSADELLELRDEIAIATKEADQGDVDNWDAADLKRRVREHLKQKNRMG